MNKQERELKIIRERHERRYYRYVELEEKSSIVGNVGDFIILCLAILEFVIINFFECPQWVYSAIPYIAFLVGFLTLIWLYVLERKRKQLDQQIGRCNHAQNVL